MSLDSLVARFRAHGKKNKAVVRTKKPRFKLGDKVRVVGAPVAGVISYVGSYDPELNQYRYKVLEKGGRRLNWNEKSLRRI